jgi:hypothetical protein
MKRLLKIVAIPAVMLVGSLMTAPSTAQAGYGYGHYGYRPVYNYSYGYYARPYNYSYYNYYPSYYGGFCY